MNEMTARQRAGRLFGALATIALVAGACGSDAATTESGSATTQEDAATTDTTAMDMDDMEMVDGDGGHEHGDVIDVPDGMAIPEISITVEPDPKSGQNLFVDVANFEIAPRDASTDPIEGEGHLHLYIDGEREMRFYNTAIHLAGLSEGEHEIEVEVSANNHSAYALDGVPIRAAATITVEPSEHAHDDGEVYEVAADAAPTVELEVVEDPKSGWNLFIETTDFTFAPEAASTDPVDGEGHLHLYVDGEKQGRIYGPAWHLPSLTEGDHEVEVELSANSHAPYAIDGEPIRAAATISVSAEQAMAADAGHDEHMDDDDEHMEDGAMEDAVTIEASIAEGAVTIDADRFDVDLGSTVKILVEADSADHVHVHGYDLMVDTTPGTPAEVVFEADVAGVFEVELEEAGLFLFELAVGS